jgi:uncharacterized membrane protein HdeD (DUF308 family)
MESSFFIWRINHMESKIATALKASRFPRWVVLVEGGLALIFGPLLITAPRATSVFLVTVLGLYFLIRGLFSIIEIFLPKRGTHCGWHLLMGTLGIIAGIVVLRHLAFATAVLEVFSIVFVAIVGLIMGIVGLIRAVVGGGWGLLFWESCPSLLPSSYSHTSLEQSLLCLSS